MLERKLREDEVIDRIKYDDVVKENKILDMKLKTAKHQLLIYTAPSARATTASMMTGRSTFRQPPSTFRPRVPLTGGTGSIDRPISAPALKKKSEGDKLQLATDEKLAIVRLNRTLKTKNEEIAELKYTIEKMRQLHSNGSAPPSRQSISSSSSSSSKSVSNNNNDDEEKSSELEEISDMAESDRSTPIIEEKKRRRGSNGTRHTTPIQPPLRIPDQSEKVLIDKLKISENDLAILKEECELLKKANERLIQQHDSPPPVVYEPIRKRQSQSDINRMRKADDDLLQKLYNEVADILNSHDVGIAEMSALGSGKESLGRWQKLYSELYEELEKVRNMLVVQYDINQKQMNEIKLLKEELERLKTVSAEILLKSKEELEEKQKKIFMLEEQIRTIAYSGQQPVKLLSNEVKVPVSSLNTDLIVKLVHVKPSPSLVSKFFFSMEFFDFQLETSPILDPKEQNIEFTTIYDVLVSNLLIHYLQMNGIVIEMYRPSHDSYKLLAAATISLIPLFEDNVLRKFCSEIVMKSVETGIDMCTLRYEIEVSEPISNNFKKFKTSEIARNMMPLKLENEEIEENEFEPLTIMVNRIVGLESLGREPSAEFCIVYELLIFHRISLISRRIQKSDRKKILYSKERRREKFVWFRGEFKMKSERENAGGSRKYTSVSLFQSISFFLIENIPKHDGVTATLQLPLHPLCKLGGSIKGTFPMLDTNGRHCSVSLDLCLIWKHEIPSFFLKPEPIEESKEDTPILPMPVRRSSKQFDVTPVDESEQILRKTVPEPSSPPQLLPTKQSSPSRKDSISSTDTSFSSDSKDLFNPIKEAAKIISISENPENSLPYPYRAEEDHEEEDRIVFDDDDDIESVSAISSQREPELPILQDSRSSPPNETKPEDGPDAETPRIESPEEQERSSEDTPRAVESERPDPSSDNIKENVESESRDSTPTTQRSVEEAVEPEPQEAEENTRRELKTEELHRLLGVLPPIAKPRNIPVAPLTLTEQPTSTTSTRIINPTGRIIFTDPLHHSIPPSESSSTSSPRQKPPVPLPDYEGQSLVKVRKPLSPTDKNVLEPNMKVTIQLETFELIPGSNLTHLTREDTKCFVDWVFLDFSNEQSKSSIFNFPRRPQDVVDIGFSKEYTLTRGQVSLLDQWCSSQIKLEFTVIKVSSSGDEELLSGNFVLQPSNTMFKSFAIDMCDMMSNLQAELTITLHYSRALFEQLNG
uniref:C2-C2_1 domain-containing protein n=1 Tax=Caenorhabditis tropicalis TaxID=1561998 RepID=A0A1I7THW9_9PELO